MEGAKFQRLARETGVVGVGGLPLPFLARSVLQMSSQPLKMVCDSALHQATWSPDYSRSGD